MANTPSGEPDENLEDERHLGLRRINAETGNRIKEIITANYSGSRYEDPEREIQIAKVTKEVRDVLREKVVDLDALNAHFFSENFTVDGLPIITEDELAELSTKFPYLANLLKRIASKPNPHLDAPLNRQFIGVNKKGRLTRLKTDTLSLRSREYFHNVPEGVLNEIKTSNSSLPVLKHISRMIDEHRECIKKTKEDTRLTEMELSDAEILALATSVDHLKNYFLFFLNILLLIAKSKDSPDILKGAPTNTYLQKNKGRVTDTKRTGIYLSSVDELLNSEASEELTQFMNRNFDSIVSNATALVEAYYGFISTRDIAYLQNLDLSAVDFMKEEVMPKIEKTMETFEKAVNTGVSTDDPSDKTDNTMIKREFYKKVLRHERDGDHPGINLTNALSHVGPAEEPEPALVCGLAYGGIEFPMLYKAMKRVRAKETHQTIDEGKEPKVAFLLLSNYNIAFTPTFTPRIEAHMFPKDRAENLEGKTALIMDDNIITGKTVTQIEVAFRAKGANTTFAVNDLNLDPRIVARETVLSANLENNAVNAVRPIPKRDTRETKGEGKSKRRKAPDFMNASRYFK